jgi:hypothetical protein
MTAFGADMEKKEIFFTILYNIGNFLKRCEKKNTEK